MLYTCRCHYIHVHVHMYYAVYSGTSLYYGHPQDNMKCPDYRGVLISEVVLYTSLCSWDRWIVS